MIETTPLFEAITYSGGAVGTTYFVYKIVECILGYKRNDVGLKQKIEKLEENDIYHMRIKMDSIDKRLRAAETLLSALKIRLDYLEK